LPWSVKPLPTIPTSKASTLPDVIEQLDQWFAALDDWLHIWRKRNVTFFRRLPKIEEQIRLLLQRAEADLPEKGLENYGVDRPSTFAAYHELLARCLSSYRHNDLKNEEAAREFKTAMSLDPEIAECWYSYVRHLVVHGRVCQALREINAVDMRMVESEHDSIAQQIINWALAYPEIAREIRPGIIKRCIELVSRVGTGLLVIGTPLPHASGEKWQRTEILRVLWAGMQCSVPVDELCKREGIDEATYYRWRKKYLPKEWGNEPALV